MRCTSAVSRFPCGWAVSVTILLSGARDGKEGDGAREEGLC